MNKYKVYAGLVSLSIVLIAAVCITSSGVVTNGYNSMKRDATATKDYRLVLNVNNQATTAEVGSWNNPGSETNLATRNTQMGNPITIKFASGNGVTRNGDPTFCQMPGSNNGWFANVGSSNKLSGITSIKLTTYGTGSRFVFDFSNNVASMDYAYSSSVPAGVTRTSEYTGSKTYSIDLEGEYNYFRLQNIGSSALGVVSIEIEYNCYESHIHDSSTQYIEHEAHPAFRGVDGNVAYKECSLCHKLFNNEYTEIELEDTIEKSYFFTVVGSTEEENFNYVADDDALITVDVYLANPSLGMRVFFRCSEPWTRTVCARIYGETFEYTLPISGKANDGVRYIGKTYDNYYRYEFDLSKMPKEDGFDGVGMIGVYKWEHSSGYLDVNTKGGTLLRGTSFSPSNDSTVEYSTPYSLSGLTINVDVYFTSSNDTKMHFYFGDGWSDHFGYFDIYPTTKTGDYDGLSVSILDDGYTRYSFHIENVTIKEGSPEKIDLFYMWKKYTTASGYYDISFVDNLVHYDAKTPFRDVDGCVEHYKCSICGKYFDTLKVPTTSELVIRKSAFFEFDNTILPKSSSERIRYNIPENKQLDFGDTFVIDFKLEQIGENSEIGFLIGDSDSAYFGKFWVDCRNKEYPRLQNSYGNGVTSTFVTDNYLRVSVELDKDKINADRQKNVTNITKFDYVEILPGTDNVTCTGTLEILPEKGYVTDAVPFIAGKERAIEFPSGSFLKKSSGTVTADLLIEGNDKKVSVRIGNWNKYSGHYNLYSSTKTGDYVGITVTNLSNGLKRFVFELSKLTEGTIVDDTEDYVHFLIRGDWTTANGLVKVAIESKFEESPAMEDIY